MDLLTFHLDNVNWIAVLVAILPSFVIGSVWYMPQVFGKYWMKANKLKQKDFENANFFTALVKTTVMNLIMVTGLAVLMSALDFDTVTQGAVLGALVSLVFAATSRGVHLAFEYRPFGLFLINGAHDVLFLAVAGAILGAF
jgi:hypothetical protein